MSNDWREHNGGPQPVADDVWVEVLVAKAPGFDVAVYQQQKAASADWPHVSEYRILNPDTIAREAVLDQLTSEAQADNMGYDND